jgi:hypothetical protein
MIHLQIDEKLERVWRCKALTSAIQVFRRERSADLWTKDRLVTSSSSGPNYYLEVILADRILCCWIDSRIEVEDVTGIDTKAKTIQLKAGDTIPTRTADRAPNEKEREFIQQERLIESNNAIAAALNTANKQPAMPDHKSLASPK